MTRQEMFDKAVKGLAAQGWRRASNAFDGCFWRTPDGDPEKYIRLYNEFWFTQHTLNLSARWCATQMDYDLAFIGIRWREDSMPFRRRKLSLSYINSELRRLCREYGI